MGKCKSECRTIARACEQIAEEVDLTDLSAMLFKGAKRATIFNWMCHESTDVCAKKTPALPAVSAQRSTRRKQPAACLRAQPWCTTQLGTSQPAMPRSRSQAHIGAP